VQVDLIAVKVRVEGGAVGVVHADGLLPLEHARAVRHEAGLVQRGLAVGEHDVAVLWGRQGEEEGRGDEQSGCAVPWALGVCSVCLANE